MELLTKEIRERLLKNGVLRHQMLEQDPEAELECCPW